VLVFDVNETSTPTSFSLGEAVLRMLGDVHGVRIADDDLQAVRAGFANMPARADVAAGLGQLRERATAWSR
jgi:2-haloacid dehalogenase